MEEEEAERKGLKVKKVCVCVCVWGDILVEHNKSKKKKKKTKKKSFSFFFSLQDNFFFLVFVKSMFLLPSFASAHFFLIWFWLLMKKFDVLFEKNLMIVTTSQLGKRAINIAPYFLKLF